MGCEGGARGGGRNWLPGILSNLSGEAGDPLVHGVGGFVVDHLVEGAFHEGGGDFF